MKTICIDIDGTIVHYEDWKGDYHFGSIVPGAIEAMKELKSQGWYIIIYTTRGNKSAVESFLNCNGIPFDSINENPHQPENAKGGKPIADVYLDDRAVTFEGNWGKTVELVNNFKTWENAKKNR